MKRINILKGIEQILIQKAYETGHISHRADGDWQKTNDGWKRISGYDKGSHQWKSDKRQRSLTADEIQELQQISNIDERRKRQSEMLSQPAPQAQGSTGNTEYGEITEEDLIETPKFDSNEDREFDSLQKSITKMYDTGALKDDISQIPADSSGSSPDEKEVRGFVNDLLRMHGMSRSRLTTDHLDALEEQVTDLWHKGQVGKSAVRDMRSVPTTKNMGF